jgi:hypothetical protein
MRVDHGSSTAVPQVHKQGYTKLLTDEAAFN